MKTSQNYIPKAGFTNELASLTVPDQSLTLRQLLTNYTRGQELPQANNTPAFFDENAFIPNIKKMDLVDIQELMEDNAKKAGDSITNLNNLRTKLTTPTIPIKKEEEATSAQGAQTQNEL